MALSSLQTKAEALHKQVNELLPHVTEYFSSLDEKQRRLVAIVAAVAGVSAVALPFVFGSKMKQPPNVSTGLPFVGTAMAFNKQPAILFRDLRHKHGNIFTISLIGKKFTILAGVEGQKYFFRAKGHELDFDAAIKDVVGAVIGSDAYSPLNPLVKHGTALIKKHLMSKQRLDFFVQIATAVAKKKAEKWASAGRIDDVFLECSQLVMEINTICFIGMQTWAEDLQRFNSAYYDIESSGFEFMVLFFPSIPTSKVRKLNRAKKVIHEVVKKACDRVRGGKPDDGDDSYLKTLALHELPDGSRIDARYIMSHLLGAVFAAHTNTAGTLSWTISHLAADKKSLSQLQTEIDAARKKWRSEGADMELRPTAKRVIDATGVCIDDELNELSYDRLKSLPFIDACMKETTRLHFPSFLVRCAAKDLYFTKDGAPTTQKEEAEVVVPKGRLIGVSPLSNQLDETHFDNASTYSPQRYIDDEKAKNAPHVQFGAGPHRCLGEFLANAVLKAAWSTIFADFDVTLDPRHNGVVPTEDWSKSLGTPFAKEKVSVLFTKRSK